MWQQGRRSATAAIICAALVARNPVQSANCSVTSVGHTALTDLGTGLYLDEFQGGLYPGGSNVPPPAHLAAGTTRAQSIEPLANDGQPSSGGKYILLSVGISNTTLEFCSASSLPPCDPWTFTGQALVDPRVEQAALAIVNGASSGEPAEAWESPAAVNYDRIRNEHLTPRGLTEAQVQIVWIKLANPSPDASLPAADADAFVLQARLGNIVRALKVRYLNVKLIFLSNRIYAGYASTALNPEPYAYESGFAVKWLIEAQIEQMAGAPPDLVAGDLDYDNIAPWIAWGPDLWADGLNARSDGLTYACTDFASDGTHPAMSAAEKVGTLLLNFMLDSPFSAQWFHASGAAAVPAVSRLGLIVLAVAVGGAGLRLVARRTRASKRREPTRLTDV